jgi:hypothetical protein
MMDGLVLHTQKVGGVAATRPLWKSPGNRGFFLGSVSA